jgi:hypothetical protein
MILDYVRLLENPSARNPIETQSTVADVAASYGKPAAQL